MTKMEENNSKGDTQLRDDEAFKLLGAMSWLYLRGNPGTYSGAYKSFYGDIRDWGEADQESIEKEKKQGVKYSVSISEQSLIYNSEEDIYSKNFTTSTQEISEICTRARKEHNEVKIATQKDAVSKARGLIKKLK